MIDIHSHLLPNVDDGVHTFTDSLAILRGYSEQGITDIIITPHYIAETEWTSKRYQNQRIFAKLKDQAVAAKIPINIYLGNEIYIDPNVAELLKSCTISSLADSKYLLLELPMSGEYAGADDIFLSLIQAGYKVILAHPERYQSSHKNIDHLLELHEMGVLFQCNLGSIIGQYGKNTQKTLKKLAKADLIFCFGTDIHHTRDYSEIAKAQKKLRKYYSADRLQAVLATNARKILCS